jgi:MFS family permease
MEPLAFYSIFPYIAQMAQRNGNLAEYDIGFYSGLFESLFSAVQAICLIFWSSMADRYGGKTMLICSLLGTSAGTLLFGFATSLWQMALFRSLSGAVDGATVIVRAMIGERCTSETRTQAFSWCSFAGNIALFLGPLVGCALANPAGQYLSMFGGIVFFERHPFAFPGIALSVLSASCALIVYFFVEESVREKDSHSEAELSDSPSLFAWSYIWELLKAPRVASMLSTFIHVMILASAVMAVVGTLTLYTGKVHGGLGFSAHQITLYLLAQGISKAIWVLLVFLSLQRRVGTNGMVNAGAVEFPLFFAGYIVMNTFLRNGSPVALITYRVVLGIMTLIGPAFFILITAIQIGVQDVAPSPRAIGALTAMAESANSIVQAVFPAISTTVSAISAREQILNGYLGWVILIVIGGCLGLRGLSSFWRNSWTP